MKKVSHKAPKVKAIHKDDATPQTPLEEETKCALDTRIALIQALIPLGLDAVAEELQERSEPLGRCIDTHAKTPKIPIVGGAVNKVRCISPIRKCPYLCSEGA